jgi:gentisate 1,2-dioxygenase
MNMTDRTALADAANLEDLRELLNPLEFMAGWNKHEPSLWKEPRTQFRPFMWRYGDAKAGLDAAGRLINAEQAERRNLFMVNPIEGNHYASLRTLVTAYQMILPAETARTHRHSPNALRLVMDVADKCYTIVDGIRIDMEPGDVLLTPGMSWHGHGNEGSRPGYWIDYLDVPLVHLLEPMFFDMWDGLQPVEQTTRDHPFVFTLASTRAQLKDAKMDDYGRKRIQLDAPSMPTTALYMQELLAGQSTSTLRSTENQIISVVSGRGMTQAGGETFHWERGDTIVLPTWNAVRHTASEDALLFCVSDLPVHEKLGFARLQAED